MDYYVKKFQKLQEEFHEVIENYPLFKEMIDDIYDKDIKEIEELLEKEDEFYLKKAINKLESLIRYIKETSTKIKEEYALFDTNAKKWERLDTSGYSEEKLKKINEKIEEANKLISKHDLKCILEANKILSTLLKTAK